MTSDWLTVHGTGFGVLQPLLPLMVKVSILLVLACTVHATLGRRRVLIRSGLWNAVLLAAVLLPIESLSLPRYHVAWLAPSESIATAEQQIALPVSYDPSDSRPRDAGEKPEATAPAATTPPGLDRTNAKPNFAGRTASTPLVGVLVGVYWIGVILLSLKFGASVVAVAKLKRYALEVDNRVWIVPLSRWRNRLGISRSVTLVSSDRVCVPLVLGWLQPVIVISSEDATNLALRPAYVDSILLHELAHLKRGDDIGNLLQQVVQILYWPHPMIWWAGRLIGGRPRAGV